MATVSVVLLQHGLCYMTRVALKSIWEAVWLEVPTEGILVDNGTRDGEIDLFWHYEDLIRILSPRNVGYVRGTNAGWRIARGDYILLCNNDIAVANTCIARLVRAMDENPALGWVSACYQQGGWQAYTTEFPDAIVKELDASQGANRTSFNAWANKLGDTPQLVYHEVSEATVVMVRREVSDRIGVYWDELVYGHSHDYALRLKAEGYKTAACHNAVFWHNQNHPTLAKLDPDGELEKANRERSEQLLTERWGDVWKGLSAR
jgi:GT2 family glycosyltransferase